MKYLKIIIISLIVSVIVSIGILAYVYNYVSLFPVKILDERGERMLGVSVTELSGTDTMSGFPTVYNANLNSLNDGKIEISTTTLPLLSTLLGLTSVGTIGTGIWQGTAITVAYQGTGTTSPTLNQIILGNAASGFKVVSGFGSSGQFLTSSGAGVVPTWTTSAINTAIAYDWTGEHSWAATSTMATSTIAELIASNLTTDSITPNNATTTINGDLLISGNFDFTGNQYTGIKWEFISSASISSASTSVPLAAKIAIINYNLRDTDPTPDNYYKGQVILEVNNMNSIIINISDAEDTLGLHADPSHILQANFEWTSDGISINEGGFIETFLGTIYFYK